MSYTTQAERWQAYLAALKTDFHKLCKLEFLQPDGTVAYVLDNNPNNPKSRAFIQDGKLNCNLQNGQRRSANVKIVNTDHAFDYAVNHVWFGQEILLSEGLILPDGSEFYLPQGVFLIKNPQEVLKPNQREAVYPLVDKWANLDGTLYGRLEGTYEVPVGSDIFTAIKELLGEDRGNGQPVDRIEPLFTEYYNGTETELPDGTTAPNVVTPYTLREDSDTSSLASVILGLNTMLAGWVGYDATGRFRLEPSQDDILDVQKPVQWAFTPTETQFLGATYTVKNTDVYNDVIIMGEALGTEPQACARAQNLDPASDTNINLIGRKTYRESKQGYYTNQICAWYAEWKLKRITVLQKSVSIESTQMFHLSENNLVTIRRPDKPGMPMERHLIQGFSRPLASTGPMTINAVSVADIGVATMSAMPWDTPDATSDVVDVGQADSMTLHS